MSSRVRAQAEKLHLQLAGLELPLLDNIQGWDVDTARDEAVPGGFRDRLQRTLNAVKDVLHDTCTTPISLSEKHCETIYGSWNASHGFRPLYCPALSGQCGTVSSTPFQQEHHESLQGTIASHYTIATL